MRKARQVASAKAEGNFAPPARCISASVGYSPIKPLHLPDRIAVVLWLPESSKPDAARSIPADLAKVLPAVHRVLMSKDKDAASSPRPGAVFIIDGSPLVPAGGSARDIMDREVSEAGADARLGKQFSKPVSKILDRLLAGYRGSVTLVGVGAGAPLALCLLEQHGTTSIERVVLVKPYISPAAVNALLVTQSTRSPPVLDVLYESARDCQRRDGSVRHAFPKGHSSVLDSHVTVGGALYSSLLSDPTSGSTVPPPATALQASLIDADEMDPDGRTVSWSAWSFELNKNTKQPEAVVVDLDPWDHVTSAKATPVSPVSPPASPPGASSASSCPGRGCDECPAVDTASSAGALILRGNRCVLVRSLESPPAWKGMRIPRMALRPHEPPVECALRAAAESCDIEEHIDTELERLEWLVPPAALHLSEAARAMIYPFYATRQPPEGALEDADVEDEEDSYDWYTWPRAVHALRHDPRAVDTLRALACSIAAAVNAGALARKWGGYFGQEWLDVGGVPAALTPPPALLPLSAAPAAVGGGGSLVEAAPVVADYMARRLLTLETTVEQILQRLPPPTAGGGGGSASQPSSSSAGAAGLVYEDFVSMLSKPEGIMDITPGEEHEEEGGEEEGEEEEGEEEEGEEEGGEDDEADFDVIIIGAGAAGIGVAFMLTNVFDLEPGRVVLLERGDAIGTSFRMWPQEMRFISPSFNQQGWTSSFDLNSVAYGTSPAYSLHAQHPSGKQYAEYLSAVAEKGTLCVFTRTEVVRVEPADGIFHVHVSTGRADGGVPRKETLRAKKVVWACGEFQYPRERPKALAGAELCVHNSRVRSWASLPGDDFVLIGGYESGSDAAINLAKAGKQATVLASTASWNVQTPDPSTELAPYTAQRLREVTAPGFSPRPKLLAPLRVLRVEKAAGGGFNVIAARKAAEDLKQTQLRTPVVGAEVDMTAETSATGAEGSEVVVHTSRPPVLCTGFEGSVASAARHLFKLADESDEAKGCLAGAPLLTEADESTKVPGVFLVGPTVRHGELSFCFIYKFRQRFGIVADAICRDLGHDTKKAVEECRKMNMFMDDFTCCKGTCGESC